MEIDNTKYIKSLGQKLEDKKILLPELGTVKKILDNIRSSPIYCEEGEEATYYKYEQEAKEIKGILKKGFKDYFKKYSLDFFENLRLDQIESFVNFHASFLISSANFYLDTELFTMERSRSTRMNYEIFKDDLITYFDHIILRYRMILLKYSKNEVYSHINTYFIISKEGTKEALIQTFLKELALIESSRFDITTINNNN